MREREAEEQLRRKEREHARTQLIEMRMSPAIELPHD